MISLILTIYLSVQTPSINLPSQIQKSADFSFYDVDISLLKNGKKLWTISATESQIYNASNTLFFTKIEGTVFFNQLENTQFKFTSPLGSYKLNDQQLSLVKTNAQLAMPDAFYLIICDEFNLNAESQIIQAFGNVQINSNLLSVNSQMMRVDLQDNRIYLKNNVQGSLIPY